MKTGHPPGIKGGFTEGQKRRIVALHEASESVASIAKCIGLSRSQSRHVSDFLREIGLIVESEQ